ncbi:hypothetical protein DV096_15280 [Bradymonadaceae bacterium TMQ3]|nr:hypothetical protein DV096_15280 [Bradymonadaceae bacterium TMQ3]TXC74727.1 hypothetical protein FRC91_14300 [Bradymonadales bacterium TMQ1]
MATKSATWDVIEEVGGRARMETLMRTFYDRLFDDLMIGFFFATSDKEALIASQIAYVHAHIGSRKGSYQGPPIRQAHQKMPILVGHFDRRHQILIDVLEIFEVPGHVREAWLGLDWAMRDLVIRQGDQARQDMGYEVFRPRE